MGVTVFFLAMPYASKIAIDRYIIAKWHRLDLEAPGVGDTAARLQNIFIIKSH